MITPEEIRRGEQINTSKLTEKDVRELRELRAKRVPWKEIRTRFPGISESSLHDAANGTTWRHVK